MGIRSSLWLVVVALILAPAGLPSGAAAATPTVPTLSGGIPSAS